MQTFDYAAAWWQVARPAYQSLPQNVRDLLARVAQEAGELRQLPDCSMPWPEESDLRETFDKVPAEWLALAARVIHNVTHWYPRSGDLEIPGWQVGAGWKFAHYADQSLRARLQIGTVDYHGLSLRIHEGAIRLCYQSRDMWTWQGVAPATEGGKVYAGGLRERIAMALPPEGQTIAARQARDTAAYEAFEALKGDRAGFAGGSPWWPLLMDTARFMVEEGDQAPEPGDDDRARLAAAKAREDLIIGCARKIRHLEIEREGQLWWLDRGIPIDNLIYYSHTGVFTFGWRHPVEPALLSRILDVVSEFPGAYAIKTAEGKVLEGGKG